MSKFVSLIIAIGAIALAVVLNPSPEKHRETIKQAIAERSQLERLLGIEAPSAPAGLPASTPNPPPRPGPASDTEVVAHIQALEQYANDCRAQVNAIARADHERQRRGEAGAVERPVAEPSE